MAFTVLTAEFAHETNTFNKNRTDYDAFMERYGEDTVLLFAIKGNELEVLGSGNKPPRKGASVVALVHDAETPKL